MHKCKNPECNKSLPEGLNYCNEECLRTHMNIKEKERSEKPIETETGNKFTKITQQQNIELQKIFNAFGFSHHDGTIIGKHNNTILSFLIREKEGVYDTMINKLTWVAHMSRRYLLENYLKGIESFGIIETYSGEFNTLKWRWVGIKALDNGSE